MSEAKKLTVRLLITKELVDKNPDELITRTKELVEKAASKRGVPDMSRVELEISTEGHVNIGTEDDPDDINLFEHNLVLVEASLMAVPYEGEDV